MGASRPRVLQPSRSCRSSPSSPPPFRRHTARSLIHPHALSFKKNKRTEMPTELPYAADAEESLSFDELEVLRLQYQKELSQSHVTVQTKFNYAWGLVKSPMREHQVEGVRLLQEIYRAEPTRRRECLYYLALGHYKMGNYEEARRFNALLLDKEPSNLQAQSLASLIDQRVTQARSRSRPSYGEPLANNCAPRRHLTFPAYYPPPSLRTAPQPPQPPPNRAYPVVLLPTRRRTLACDHDGSPLDFLVNDMFMIAHNHTHTVAALPVDFHELAVHVATIII
ncbi:hypothetical protein ONZ51_g51 [Trametes cubensis]|uniref:Mitochondrial fission 1 protein n=1 Tax=Trametes cubensis TaxID=1111947 RepID=A0AAD7XG33_9APHY|nr:hypothetical protein ONZ51_g51 [Trametes cubensis]